MNLEKTKIEELVLQCVSGVVEEQGNIARMHGAETESSAVRADTVLLGENGVLDSVGLVTAIVEIEQAIEGEFGCEINLADEDVMNREDSPFQTPRALCGYVVSLLSEHASEA